MKEKIHALSEEMVANLGRLVAIDSQQHTGRRKSHLEKGPAKHLA